MLNSILVELDRDEAGCIVGMLDGVVKVNPKINKKEPSIAGEIATYVTAQSGIDKIKEQLYQLETPEERRKFFIHAPEGPFFEVDSGWNRLGSSVDFRIGKGKTVSLVPEQWRDLVKRVEEIIAWCEFRREEQERETKENTKF